MRTTILTLTTLLWLASACSSAPPAVTSPDDVTSAPAETASSPDRDPALAKKLVSEGALLLDVRTQDEWDERHLEGATLIPVQELDARLEEVAKLAAGDKSKPIVVYCRSGKRAGNAKEMLQAAGYTQVVNLGGIDDWPAD